MQVLTTRAWAHLSWVDPRLTWDPTDMDGMTTLRLPSTEVRQIDHGLVVFAFPEICELDTICDSDIEN